MTQPFKCMAILLLAIFSVAVPSAVEAQQMDAKKREKAVAEFTERWKSVFQSNFDIVIEDMTKVCELDESQVKMLKFAAKGSVASATKSLKKQTDQMLGQMMQGMMGQVDFEDDENDSEDSEEGSDVENAEDVEENEFAMAEAGAFGEMDFIGDMLDGSLAHEQLKRLQKQKIWKKSMESVLTDEQRKTLKEVTKKRAAYRVAAAVEGFVAKADQQLLLSEEQREKLAAYLGKKYGKKFLQDQHEFFGYQMFSSKDVEKAAKKDEPIKEILTAAQYRVWLANYQEKLIMLNESSGFQMGIQGFALPGFAVPNDDN